MKTTTLLLALTLLVSAPWPSAAVPRPQKAAAAEALMTEADGLRGQGTTDALRAAAGRYSQALEIFHASALKEREAFALRRLGLIYKLLREDGTAASFYARALNLQRLAGDRPGELETLREMGWLHQLLGDYPAALSHYGEMLAAAQAGRSRAGEVLALSGLGGVKQAQGLFSEALDYYGRALKRAQSSDPERARILSDVGWVYYQLGDYQRALDYLYEASSAAAGDERRDADDVEALNRVGRVYEELGQHRAAIGFFQQALKRVEAGRGGPYELATLTNLARAHFAADDRVNSLLFFERARQKLRPGTRPDDVASLLITMGSAQRALGSHDGAVRLYRQALTFVDDSSRYAANSEFRGLRARALAGLGEALNDAGERAEAAEALTQGLSLARSLGDRAGEAAFLEQQGRLAEAGDDLNRALIHYKLSAAIREEIWNSANLETVRLGTADPMADAYRHCVRVNMRLGRYDDAFEFSERSRARTFLEQLGNSRPAAYADLVLIDFMPFGYAPEHVPRELVEEVKVAQGEVRSLDEKIRHERAKPNAEGAVAALEARRAQKQREYSQLLDRAISANRRGEALKTVPTLGRAEVQSRLDAETTLLSYFVTAEKTYAFVVTRDSFAAFELASTEEQLRQQVAWFRKFPSLKNPKPAILKNLYDKLVAPLGDRLRNRKLLVVPHGVLNYLPFAALHDGETFLGEQNVIYNLPSCSALQFAGRPSQPAPDRLLIFSQSGAEGLPALGHADAEASSIAALFNVKPVTGKSASRSNFMRRAHGHQYIHVAAHALLDADTPLFSRIVLAPEAGLDRWARILNMAIHRAISPLLMRGLPLSDRLGYLELQDIHSLNLTGTSMVVLSACETQVGSRGRGDDIVALNRAFLQAGARTVVASLWQVDDEATRTLMTSLYTNLKSGRSKADALRAAQAETRRQFPHPFYWAGFVLTGEPGANAPASLGRD